MSWLSGSGLGAKLQEIFKRNNFQDSALNTFKDLGQTGLDYISNPAVLKALFTNLLKHPEVAVGAMVRGTEAEAHVNPDVVLKAEAELAKPHPDAPAPAAEKAPSSPPAPAAGT